jgi:hypothetical protein
MLLLAADVCALMMASSYAAGKTAAGGDASAK